MALFLNSRLLKCTGRQFQLLAGFRGYSTFSDITHHAQPASDSLHPAASAESSALQSTELQTKQWRERLESINSKARLPRSVQAVYLRPLRRKAEFGLPVCDLQLRSYSVRNVEFFADFAVRAAYYLNLPVSGPVPLPRIVERWTVPRSNFVHKKSQENFERITLRRLVQIKDGNPQVVQTWLAFLRKHAFYGVGMKANVWEHESLDVAANMDSTLPEVKKTLEPYLSQFAVGLDPNRSTIFYQSSVAAHAELFWILCTVASMGYLSRMTQWKSKLQLPEDTTLDTSEARSRLRLGLFSYPVLQAADILVHRATHVPVGEDQKQHLEFSRNIANSFNHVYGTVFPSPESLISPAKRVMSLKEPTLKMSKSHVDERSRILLTDSPSQIHKKLKAALTDSETTITYDPFRRPGVSNLLELLGHFEGRSCEELALEFQSTSLRAFKENLAHKISNHLQPVREKYFSLMEDKTGYLEDISEKGARAARANAELTMTRVRETMGL
ncbi:hypothetical protein CBS147346_1413 [Aspergillus niger]|nr:hypothetical protein CBS147346_1413 [Aspergillus niger]